MKKFQHFTLTDFNKKTITTKQSSFLCTISGGQDSILTFFLLFQIQKKTTLHNLYCHHFWQLTNFFSARFLFQLSYLFKVSYTLILPHISILSENESRDWRKNNFCRVSQIARISINLLGHTETDTLEKNLNNILRGTSPAGLSYSSFLNYQNRAILFFSSITLTSKKKTCCYFSKQSSTHLLLVSKKNLFDILKRKNLNFYKINKLKLQSFKQNKLNKNHSPCFNKASLKSGRSYYNQRQKFKFSKKETRLVNKLSTKVPIQQNFSGNPVIKKNFRGQNIFQTQTRFCSKNQPELNSTNSYSFSFSNKFSNMRLNVRKPLKETTRFTVSKIVSLYKLPHFIDITNFSSKFSRNKIRHQLLPFIRFLFHTKVESLVNKFFKIVEEEHEEREKEIQEVFIISRIGNLNSQKLTKLSTSLMKIVSGNTIKSLNQKLFFNYKNLSLNYLQLKKIHKFF